jgi:hypothetical protein
MFSSTELSLFRRLWMSLALALMIAILTAGCEDETTQPEDDSLVLPEPSTPEALISSIELIYNDRTHGADERLAGYASLFDSTFRFTFYLNDIGIPQSWGLEEELEAHANMFAAQSAGGIYSIELRATHNPAADLNPPQVGREGWKEIFVTNVYLRLMFNPEDGLEINGGQTEFLFPPAAEGRFRIAEWTDLPRPGPLRSGSSWGDIKMKFYNGTLPPAGREFRRPAD